MPRVARLNVAPVRSLGLEQRAEIVLGPTGVVEDRRFFVRDTANRLVDQLTAGPMVQVTAWTDPDATRLRLTFPDGTVIEDDVRLGDPVETPIHGRTGIGHDVIGPWAEALSAFLHRDVAIVRCDQPGGTRRGHPTTLVSDGSVARLSEVLGVDDAGTRQFRMLIELEGGAAHVEDSWIGGRVAVGETLLRITGAIPRCAITTHDPDTGERDLDTLRAIKDYRGIVDGHLMFGVYGDIERGGRIRLGDEVTSHS